jgi:hypothetical protein
MIRGIGVALLLLINSCVFALACPRAVPMDNPGFCPSFKSVAVCHCIAKGLPAGMCQDMNALYSRMIAMFGTLQKACEYQHDTSAQDCVDNWNCYRNGGVNSQGLLCSSTSQACQ